MEENGSWHPYLGAVVGVLSDDPDALPGGFGELVLASEDGAIRVIRADPRVRLPGRLVREGFGFDAVVPPGARLAIDGTGRRLVYVIGAHHEATDAHGDWYEAEWPD